MIFTFISILIVCTVVSLPQYNHFNSDSDIKFILKKNAELSSSSEGNDFDLVEQQDDRDDKPQIAAIDASKRKVDNSTGDGGGVDRVLSPQISWSLRCDEPFCPPKTQLGISSDGGGNSERQNDDDDDDDDILLHLKSNDKDLYKFLEWTMEQLGSMNSYNASGSYYTGLNVLKKGGREMPLYVEEPKYIVVRHEADDLVQKLKESIKKDKLKSILKYEEVFFPVRGKKRTSTVFEDDGAAIGVAAGRGNGGILQDKNNMRLTSSDGYRATATPKSPRANKNYGRTFNDWLASRCEDILAAASVASAAPSSPHQQHQLMVTNQAGNLVNALVSAAAACQAIISANNANDAIAADGQRGDDACPLAACQKENDVKINAFDQSVGMQPRYSKGGAFNRQHQQSQRRRRRRLLSSSSSSSSSESLEAGASTFFPHISQPDLLDRLQQYPIRNKQWRDYYIRQMATLLRSRRFSPF